MHASADLRRTADWGIFREKADRVKRPHSGQERATLPFGYSGGAFSAEGGSNGLCKIATPNTRKTTNWRPDVVHAQGPNSGEDQVALSF